jgi:hypothetical protein
MGVYTDHKECHRIAHQNDNRESELISVYLERAATNVIDSVSRNLLFVTRALLYSALAWRMFPESSES